MDWPIATVILGVLGTIVAAIVKRPGSKTELPNGRVYAKAVDMAEIRARLVALEQAHQVMRAELRSDMKGLQDALRGAVCRNE